MSRDFRERLTIKIRNLNTANRKDVPNLMKLDLWQIISFQKASKKTADSISVLSAGVSRKEIMIWLVCQKPFYNVSK